MDYADVLLAKTAPAETSRIAIPEMHHMYRNPLKLVLGLAFALAPLSAQNVTIINARIIGPKGTVIERGSIVVRDGKIASVAAGKPASTSGRVINAAGMTAMPGFID